jgi:NitT/TauT family transport system substrate-binding protein
MKTRSGTHPLTCAGAVLALALAACGGQAAQPGSSSQAVQASVAASAKPAGSAPASAAGQERKANMAWATNTPLFLPPHVGVQSGIFQKHNIDLTLTYSSSGPTTMSALASGDVQFAELADPSVTTSALEGSGVEWIAVSVPKPNLVLWAQPNITSMNDLKGKKIGVTTLGSVTGLFAIQAIKQAGLVPQQDIQVIAIGGPTEQQAALAKGAIDAAVGDPDGPYAGQHILVDLRKGFAFPQAGIAITKGFAQKDPQLVQDFINGFVESIRRYKSDPALDYQMDAKVLQRNEADAKKEVDGAIPIMNDDVTPTTDEIKTVLDMIADTNPKAKTANPADFFDTRFAQEAKQQAAT